MEHPPSQRLPVLPKCKHTKQPWTQHEQSRRRREVSLQCRAEMARCPPSYVHSLSSNQLRKSKKLAAGS